MKKHALLLVLILTSLASVAVELPIIHRNIDDADMIAYFNHDEAFLMDLAWYYYSGHKRKSFQYESDYGVELLYLSLLSKYFFSHFLTITPNTLVLLLRWLHFIFWILSLFALYRLLNRHFESTWICVFPLLLLSTRVSFPYLSQNLKPEPIVLFFMISGLNYALQYVESASYKELLKACCCAAAAFSIKLAGIFLLPILIVGMCLNERKPYISEKAQRFLAPLFPTFSGMALLTIPLVVIVYYVRQTSGLTWLEEFGWFSSLTRNKLIPVSIGLGCLLLFFSIYLTYQPKDISMRKFSGMLQYFLSRATILFTIFFAFTITFSSVFLVHSEHLLSIIATFSLEALTQPKTTNDHAMMIYQKILDFNPILLFLFILVLILELRFWKKNNWQVTLLLKKRLMLHLFVLCGLAVIFLPIRFAHHHQLPFLVAASLLFVNPVHVMRPTKWITGCLIIVIVQGSYQSVTLFSRIYHWHEDVMFDVAPWLKLSFPAHTRILADHPTRVYLPPQFMHAKSFVYQTSYFEQLKQALKEFNPKIIYLNVSEEDKPQLLSTMASLKTMKFKLIKQFTQIHKKYKRYPNSEYSIYEVIYEPT